MKPRYVNAEQFIERHGVDEFAKLFDIHGNSHCIIEAMKLRDKVVVVTGGASGIGRALCRRFAAEGARAVVVSDIDEAGAKAVASEIGGTAVRRTNGDARRTPSSARPFVRSAMRST